MIITTKQFLSSVWLIVALLVATLLIAVLPKSAQAQVLASESVTITGYASWYNLGNHGVRTASGERYDHKAMTAAHPTLPFDSMVRVENVETGAAVIVRINDRMQSGPDHIIDLSGAAARQIGLFESGAAEVYVSLINDSPMDLLPDENSFSVEMGPPLPVENQSDLQPDRDAQSVIRTVSEEPSKTSVERFTLQIGSFSTKEGAVELAEQYEQAWIAQIDVNGKTNYRVYYSKFEEEEPARSVQTQLWANGQDSFLRKVIS